MTDQPRHHGPGHQPRDHGVAHHPRYQGTDEDAGVDAGVDTAREQRTPWQRWRLVVLIAVVAALVLAVLIMHMTGAMPKGTGF